MKLFIPGISNLLSGIIGDSRATETLPGFCQLLSSASFSKTDACEPYTVVAEQVGIDPMRQSGFPHAAYSRYAAFREENSNSWLHVSPISYTSASSGLILNRIGRDQLSSSDLSQLTDLMKTELTLGGELRIEEEDRGWRVDASDHPAIKTHALWEVAEGPVSLHMPSGGDATFWAQWLAECEMVLHSHPLNVAREREGRALISSFWLWGEGRLPPKKKPGDISSQLLSDDPALSGMAQHHDVQSAGFDPGNIEAEKETIVAADLTLIDRSLDSSGLMNWLTHTDAEWIQPAMHLIKIKNLSSMTMIDPVSGASWRLKPVDLYKFWRRKPRRSHFY